MSIQISKLSKTYGTQKVLKNIAFEIAAGEVVGFLGPNGAGKTTTMKIIAGALAYDSGSVSVCGWEVWDNPLKTKSLIGYLPEQNPLYTDMYVKEYLHFVASSYDIKHKKERIGAVIEQVGLLPEYKKKIRQLSKGYRQRVGLAQALIPDPNVLILDEPTTGLDPNQLDEIRMLIRNLGKERTVLLSTHIMQEIKAICNRVIVINQGEIVADYTDLSERTTFEEACFRFEVEFAETPEKASLQSISGIRSLHAANEKSFEITAGSDIRATVFDWAVSTGNKILTLKTKEQSMEEVFRNLTK